jgi:hypothetical protein
MATPKRPRTPKAGPQVSMVQTSLRELNNSGPMDALSLTGFKSHKDTQDIALRPLTLLAGGNSSGKSSLLQPLLLMKQTIETPFEPPPLYLGGPIVSLDNAADLFWCGDEKHRAETFSIGLHLKDVSVRVSYRHDPAANGGLRLEETRLRLDGAPKWISSQGGGLEAAFERFAPMGVGLTSMMRDLVGKDAKPDFVFVPGRCAHDVWLGATVPAGEFHPFLPLPVTLARDQIAAIIHLPGLRDGPERSYAVTGVSGRFPGRFPEYTASLLHLWQQQEDERLLGVTEDLRALALADRVEAQRLNDRRVELRVSRRIGGSIGDMVNIADVGVGVSQVLPIVVALRAAGKDQLVHIEQPELHLHPRAEIALAGLFVAAARRGARLVLETHSSTLLRAFQAAVAEDDTGWVQQNLALHWFARDATGESKVTTAEVQADGSFGDWPVDLNLVEMEMTRRLLTASHARRAKAAKAAP